MNWRTHLGMLLLVAVAVAGLQYRWQPSASHTANMSSTNLSATAPDLQIEKPVMEHFDEAGQLAWRVEGRALQHYETEDRTEIQDPVALIQAREREDKPPAAKTPVDPETPKDPWHLKAQSATMTQQHTQIALNGDAHVSNSEMTITSQQLFFDTTRQFATTDKAVTIHAHGSTAHAAGLEADLTNKILRLPAQVKETHEPNKRP